MPDPQTPNLGLFVPLNGADVGTWDVPMNINWNLLDTVLCANGSIALSNVPITLSSAQYNNSFIIFTGALTGNVEVTFPAIGRSWIVLNNCTNTGSFFVRALVTVGNGYVGLPAGEAIMIGSDGTNMRFVGFDRIGSYWDFAGSAIPLWVTASNPQPYLNCNGATFASSTYPALAIYLGGTTLPDARGRFRATLNQGTARQSGGTANGLNADTILNAGGVQAIPQACLPSYNMTGTGGSHLHTLSGLGTDVAGAAAGSDLSVWINANNGVTQFANVGAVTVPTAGGGNNYAPPSYAGGLTLIRAG